MNRSPRLPRVAAFPPGRRELATTLAVVAGTVWLLASAPAGGAAPESKREPRIGEVRRFEGHKGEVWGVAFSPDGRHVLSCSGDRTVRIWDAATGKELRRLRGHRSWVFCLAVSPDGRRLASGARSSGFWRGAPILVWDLGTGKELLRLKGHDGSVRSVAFSPDGRRLLSGGLDGSLMLWDLDSGKELRRFEGHTEDVLSVAFSPDGRLALSSGWDKTLRLWDVATGKQLRRFQGHRKEVFGVALSPDGRRAVSCGGGLDGEGKPVDNTMRLWDVATGKELRRFEGHQTTVNSVAFSPDGRRILSGSGQVNIVDGLPEDCTVRLWDVATGEELCRFQGHTDRVTGVAFSPDGKYGLSGSFDQTVRLWRLPGPGDKVAAEIPAQGGAPAAKGGQPWEVVTAGAAAVAVPRGWRDAPVRPARMLLFRQGDGLGVPAVDETGAPLQIGLTVEKFPRTEESLKEGMAGLVRNAKRERRLKLVGEEKVEPLKLSDGTEAMLLTAEFIKDGSRRSLQLKMLAKDRDSNGWVVSGYLVGGKDSKLPTSDSELGRWLRALVTSFCLDRSKFDEEKLNKAQPKPAR